VGNFAIDPTDSKSNKCKQPEPRFEPELGCVSESELEFDVGSESESGSKFGSESESESQTGSESECESEFEYGSESASEAAGATHLNLNMHARM
jgi:hypothetical protein